MNKKNYNEIFSTNLMYILSKKGKRQIDLSKDLNIPKATVSSWCLGTRMPKMDKITDIANYFDIQDPIYLLKEDFKESV